jgi:hypothetical protein
MLNTHITRLKYVGSGNSPNKKKLSVPYTEAMQGVQSNNGFKTNLIDLYQGMSFDKTNANRL